MKTIKVACNVSGVGVNSTVPNFRYMFEEAGVPLEIREDHAKKILRNKDFYISDKSVKKDKNTPQIKSKKEKPWLQELEEVKGIGEKTSLDIIAVYPTKGALLEAIASKAKIPFRDDVVIKLKKEFIH